MIFFCKSSTILNNGSVLPEITDKTVNRLSKLEISNCDVIKILNNFNLNKARGCDGFENCLETGDFPDTWKCD